MLLAFLRRLRSLSGSWPCKSVRVRRSKGESLPFGELRQNLRVQICGSSLSLRSVVFAFWCPCSVKCSWRETGPAAFPGSQWLPHPVVECEASAVSVFFVEDVLWYFFSWQQ